MPPPTVNGMSMTPATFLTTLAIVSLPCCDAVMSRNTSSSAPCSRVFFGKLDWVTGVLDLCKMHSLDNPAVIDVKTRDSGASLCYCLHLFDAHLAIIHRFANYDRDTAGALILITSSILEIPPLAIILA